MSLNANYVWMEQNKLLLRNDSRVMHLAMVMLIGGRLVGWRVGGGGGDGVEHTQHGGSHLQKFIFIP